MADAATETVKALTRWQRARSIGMKTMKWTAGVGAVGSALVALPFIVSSLRSGNRYDPARDAPPEPEAALPAVFDPMAQMQQQQMMMPQEPEQSAFGSMPQTIGGEPVVTNGKHLQEQMARRAGMDGIKLG